MVDILRLHNHSRFHILLLYVVVCTYLQADGLVRYPLLDSSAMSWVEVRYYPLLDSSATSWVKHPHTVMVILQKITKRERERGKGCRLKRWSFRALKYITVTIT